MISSMVKLLPVIIAYVKVYLSRLFLLLSVQTVFLLYCSFVVAMLHIFIYILFKFLIPLIFQAAQAVLIALYNLNNDEFEAMINVLPKTFQVTKHSFIVLHYNITYEFYDIYIAYCVVCFFIHITRMHSIIHLNCTVYTISETTVTGVINYICLLFFSVT